MFKKPLIYLGIILFTLSCNTDKKSFEDDEFKIKKTQDSLTRIGYWDYYLNKDYNEAIFYFSKALELDSEYYLPLDNRARTYFDKGQYDKAISDYTKIIELFLNSSRYENRRSNAYDYYLERGIAKYEIGDYRGAVSDFDKVITNSGSSYLRKNASFYNGFCNIKIGNYSEACKNFSMAGELGESRAYDYIREYCN